MKKFVFCICPNFGSQYFRRCVRRPLYCTTYKRLFGYLQLSIARRVFRQNSQERMSLIPSSLIVLQYLPSPWDAHCFQSQRQKQGTLVEHWVPLILEILYACTSASFSDQFLSSSVSFFPLVTKQIYRRYQSCLDQAVVGGPKTHHSTWLPHFWTRQQPRQVIRSKGTWSLEQVENIM